MKQEPILSVGIVSASEIQFTLHGNFNTETSGIVCTGEQTVCLTEKGIQYGGECYAELTFCPTDKSSCFTLNDVVIGIGFHWERKEPQSFAGSLRIIVEENRLTAVNVIPVEEYLKSVISSEMSATASLELLRAHAVISRSWLLSQLAKKSDLQAQSGNYISDVRTETEWIKWWDREDHTLYDVCADDHCQRYQGITRATTPAVVQAVEATRGEVLMYNGAICDARFSKCCGGVLEKFDNCWEPASHPYLQKVFDRKEDALSDTPDLSIEAEAEKWIRTSPEAFCNTRDKQILSQVLNNYDQETVDFYRWKVRYSQSEVAELLARRTGIDFGQIVDLQPVERGVSGRMIRLRIVGTKKTMVIGKELLIRKSLSESHLYSSAFVVEREHDKGVLPIAFTLTGAGWGHGVGLCQIGAAVMGEQGYDYRAILLHYYRDAEILKSY